MTTSTLTELPEGAKLFLAALPDALSDVEYLLAVEDARREAEAGSWCALECAAVADQLARRLTGHERAPAGWWSDETPPAPRPATGGPEEREALRRGYHAELDQIADDEKVGAMARAEVMTARAVLHLAETIEAIFQETHDEGVEEINKAVAEMTRRVKP